MNGRRRVKREFREEISGELHALDRAIQEFGSTIRTALRGIAEAAADAQDEVLEESEFGASVARWAEAIPLNKVRRSREVTLDEVREIAPLLASTRKPDLLYEARSGIGLEELPQDVTASLAILICGAVFDALGVDPGAVRRIWRDTEPAVDRGSTPPTPVGVAEKPAPVAEKPAPVAEKPAPVAEKPAPVVEKPAPGDEETWKLIEEARAEIARAEQTVAGFTRPAVAPRVKKAREALLREARDALEAALAHYDRGEYATSRAYASSAATHARGAAADPGPGTRGDSA